MSVAVFSADAVTARMLLLEAKRCGFREESPEKARVWLVDLDHPVTAPARVPLPVQIGFCADTATVNASLLGQMQAVHSLPLRAGELSLLHSHEPSSLSVWQEGEELWLSGKKIHLSKLEKALLHVLLENRDRTVTTEELSAIIGKSAENSNAAAVYLYRLRRKLEADGPTRIRTVRGVGYRWLGD